MARVQNALTLVVSHETATRIYQQRPNSSGYTVPRDLRLTAEMIDILPEPLRATVRQLVSRGGVEAHLMAQEDNLTVEIRNKKPRVSNARAANR